MPVSLVGYTVFPGQTITIQAVDQNTGNLVARGTTTSASSGIPSETPGGNLAVLVAEDLLGVERIADSALVERALDAVVGITSQTVAQKQCAGVEAPLRR
jgi:hypothetical protein